MEFGGYLWVGGKVEVNKIAFLLFLCFFVVVTLTAVAHDLHGDGTK